MISSRHQQNNHILSDRTPVQKVDSFGSNYTMTRDMNSSPCSVVGKSNGSKNLGDLSIPFPVSPLKRSDKSSIFMKATSSGYPSSPGARDNTKKKVSTSFIQGNDNVGKTKTKTKSKSKTSKKSTKGESKPKSVDAITNESNHESLSSLGAETATTVATSESTVTSSVYDSLHASKKKKQPSSDASSSSPWEGKKVFSVLNDSVNKLDVDEDLTTTEVNEEDHIFSPSHETQSTCYTTSPNKKGWSLMPPVSVQQDAIFQARRARQQERQQQQQQQQQQDQPQVKKVERPSYVRNRIASAPYSPNSSSRATTSTTSQEAATAGISCPTKKDWKLLPPVEVQQDAIFRARQARHRQQQQQQSTPPVSPVCVIKTPVSVKERMRMFQNS